MPLNKKELAMLRKQYPAQHFEIREEGNKLQIVPKTVVIRLYKKQLKRLDAKTPVAERSGDNTSEHIAWLMANKAPGPEEFEQCQVTVKKEVADKIAKEAKACNTKKLTYLMRLMGEFP